MFLRGEYEMRVESSFVNQVAFTTAVSQSSIPDVGQGESVGSNSAVGKIQQENAIQDAKDQMVDQEVKKELKKDEMDKAIKGVNGFLKSSSNMELSYVYHDDLKQYYVRLIDSTTKEVKREIPPKKLLDAYYAMEKYMGLLVDQKI